jgi:hypothetical protein
MTPTYLLPTPRSSQLGKTTRNPERKPSPLNLPPPNIGSHTRSSTASPTLHPTRVPPSLQVRVSQTVPPRPSPTHTPAGSWVESWLARARSPDHLPYTAHPNQPTLHHTRATQVAYPAPLPPPAPSRLPYLSQPAYPIPSLRRPASRSFVRRSNYACRPAHLPYPGLPASLPYPAPGAARARLGSPEATPQAAYPTPQQTQPPEDLAANLPPDSPTLHRPPGSDLRRTHQHTNTTTFSP